MRYVIPFLLCFICFLPIAKPQAVIQGIVTKNQIDGSPISGVQISAFGANAQRSNQFGQFELSFANKQAGDRIKFNLVLKDMEVVNPEVLDPVILPKDPSLQILPVILCKKGERTPHAIAYYRLNLNRNIDNNFKTELKQLVAEGLDEEKIAQLVRDRDEAKEQVEKIAQRLAEMDFSKSTDLYKSAFSLLIQGQLDSALALLDDNIIDAEIAKAQKMQQKTQKAIWSGINAYRLKAYAALSKFDFESMEKYFHKMIEIDTTEYSSYWDFGDRYAFQKQFHLALPLYEQALNLCPINYGRAQILNNLGLIYENQNNISASISAFEEALLNYKREKDKYPEYVNLGIATTLNNLGNLYRDQNDVSKALDAYQKSLVIRRQLAKKYPEYVEIEIPLILNSMGLLYVDMNEFQQALSFYDEALAIDLKYAEKYPLRIQLHTSRIFTNKATCYLYQKKYQLAKENYKKALKLLRELSKDNPDKYAADLTKVLTNLCATYQNLSDFENSIKVGEEALSIGRKLLEQQPGQYALDVGMALNNLGITYKAQEKYKEAKATYLEAINIYTQAAKENPQQFQPFIHMSQNNLGLIYVNLNQMDEAHKSYMAALDGYKKLRSLNPAKFEPLEAATWHNLGRWYRLKKNYPKAHTHYQKALEIRQKYAQEQPQRYESEVGSTYYGMSVNYLNWVKALSRSEYYEKGKSAAREAIKIYKKYPDLEKVKGIGKSAYETLQEFDNLDLPALQKIHRAQYTYVRAKQKLDRGGDKMQVSDSIALAATLFNDLLKEKRDQNLVFNLSMVYETWSECVQKKSEKIVYLKKAIELREELLSEHPEGGNLISALAASCGTLSWYLLLEKDFSSAEKYAKRGIEVEASQEWIFSNLAAALLFQGKYEDAKSIYLKYKDQAFNDKQSYREIFLADLKEFESIGIKHKDLKKIRKLLEE